MKQAIDDLKSSSFTDRTAALEDDFAVSGGPRTFFDEKSIAAQYSFGKFPRIQGSKTIRSVWLICWFERYEYVMRIIPNEYIDLTGSVHGIYS